MTLYLCLDHRNGMLFNRRRQSRDGAVLEDIQCSVPEALTIDPFSEALIRDAGLPYVLAAKDIPAGAHFFGETPDAVRLLPRAETVVIYRWNRRYPADAWWEADLAARGYTLESTRDFPGRSHDTITKEVYVR